MDWVGMMGVEMDGLRKRGGGNGEGRGRGEDECGDWVVLGGCVGVVIFLMFLASLKGV